MKNRFLLSLGALVAGVCFALGQSGTIRKTLPSEQEIQVLPPLKIGQPGKEPVSKEPVMELPLKVGPQNQAPTSNEPDMELPPLVVGGPQAPSGPLPIAAIAGALPPPVLDSTPPRHRFWAGTDYLLWWVQRAPIAAPLVTGNNDPKSIAALNQPGTIILFGADSGQSTSYGPFSGGRVTLGGWIDANDRFGLEANAFLLEERSIHFNGASAGGAAPVVSIPFNAIQPFNKQPAGETSLNSGGNPRINAPNVVLSEITSRLWGMEANGLFNLSDSERFRLAVLVGFRYLDLLENLSLSDTFTDPVTSGQKGVSDFFGARNQFYGGQIGARSGLTLGRFQLDVTTKVALGSNHQVSTINGNTQVTGGAFGLVNGTTAGGVFAEPSNMGRFTRGVFVVVPEAQFQLGYQVATWLYPFIGYNFLYMSDVLRPGNQIDRNINPTQNAILAPPGTLIGPAAPLPVFHSSDFWAQGINVGLLVRF